MNPAELDPVRPRRRRRPGGLRKPFTFSVVVRKVTPTPTQVDLFWKFAESVGGRLGVEVDERQR